MDRSFETEEEEDDDRFSKRRGSNLKKKSNSLNKKKTTFSENASVDEDYYRFLKLQQQSMKLGSKNAKSTQNLHLDERKQLLQKLPYDNFLRQKNVSVAALTRRPRDAKVMLEIEKINSKK